MAGFADLDARSIAAGGLAETLMGGVGAEAPLEGPPPPPQEEPGEVPKLEDALLGVEAALEGMDPELATQARTHVNAIREIASKAEAVKSPPPEEPAAPGGNVEAPVSPSPEEPLPQQL